MGKREICKESISNSKALKSDDDEKEDCQRGGK